MRRMLYWVQEKLNKSLPQIKRIVLIGSGGEVICEADLVNKRSVLIGSENGVDLKMFFVVDGVNVRNEMVIFNRVRSFWYIEKVMNVEIGIRRGNDDVVYSLKGRPFRLELNDVVYINECKIVFSNEILKGRRR